MKREALKLLADWPGVMGRWGSIGLVGLGVGLVCVLGYNALGFGLIVVGFLLGFVTHAFRRSRTPLDWPLGVLVILAGLSLLVTAFPDLTRPQVLRLWAGIAGCYAVVLWARDRLRLLTLISGLALMGASLAIVSPFMVDWAIPGKNVLLPNTFYQIFPLLVSDAVHPNIMASVMVLCLPVPVAWMLMGDTEINGFNGLKRIGPSGWRPFLPLVAKAAAGLVGLVMLAVLVLTRSRGGYVAGAVGLWAVLWLSGRRRLALGLLLIAGLGLGLGWRALRQAVVVPDVVEGSLDPSTLAFRLYVWRIALWMLGDFAFTGVGMGTFNDVAALLYPFYEERNPGAHNLYLQIGVDLGFPALIAYLAVLGLTLWLGWHAMQEFSHQGDKPLLALSVGTLVSYGAMLVHGLIDLTLWNTRIAFLPWLFIGALIALYQFARERSTLTAEG